jgi:hypothetical protein
MGLRLGNKMLAAAKSNFQPDLVWRAQQAARVKTRRDGPGDLPIGEAGFQDPLLARGKGAPAGPAERAYWAIPKGRITSHCHPPAWSVVTRAIGKGRSRSAHGVEQ